MCISDAASGGAGWALAHPEFGSSVYPITSITTRGADYVQCITASPPRFENLAASLCIRLSKLSVRKLIVHFIFHLPITTIQNFLC